MNTRIAREWLARCRASSIGKHTVSCRHFEASSFTDDILPQDHLRGWSHWHLIFCPRAILGPFLLAQLILTPVHFGATRLWRRRFSFVFAYRLDASNFGARQFSSRQLAPVLATARFGNS